MPVMGGLEATSAIRAREARVGGHLRIVAMPAYAMTGDRERCLAAGMDGYLSKPIDPQLLFAVVEEESPGNSARPATTGTIDRAHMLARLGGDEELLTDVIRLFLEDCPVRLTAIKA